MKVRKIKKKQEWGKSIQVPNTPALDKCISGKWREQKHHEKRRTPTTVQMPERRASESRGRKGRQGGVMEERGFIEAAGESSVIAL